MVSLGGELEREYPNGFLPFIIHYAGQKPWSQSYREEIKKSKKIADIKGAYMQYLTFIDNFMDSNE